MLTDKTIEEVSLFGAGYFDDSADLPNQPVLFYMLKGKLQQKNEETLEAVFDKTYDSTLVTPELRVRYRGDLKKGEGKYF